MAQAVPPDPALLHVRGVDRQNVAVPFSLGKTHPGMQRGFGRLRTVIHPNGARLLVVVDVIPDRDKFLRYRIPLLPNPQIQGAAVNIADNVDFALMLGNGKARRIPSQRVRASAVRDGESEHSSPAPAPDRAHGHPREIRGPNCRIDPRLAQVDCIRQALEPAPEWPPASRWFRARLPAGGRIACHILLED